MLFADVKFDDDHIFSSSATTLIKGLLQRDPTKRLGSMTNPPSDIMWSEFFEPLDWQQIYSRSIPGPISNIERSLKPLSRFLFIYITKFENIEFLKTPNSELIGFIILISLFLLLK